MAEINVKKGQSLALLLATASDSEVVNPEVCDQELSNDAVLAWSSSSKV